MSTIGTNLLLGIDPARSINPSLAADALLEQDALDPEHIGFLAEAYGEDSPTLAGHVRFCQSEYLRAEPEDRGHPKQLLANIVRRTSRPIWSQVWARAMQQFRARQSATPPPPSGTATVTHPAQTLAEILKKEPQVPDKFDPFSITLKELEQLPTLGKQLDAQVLLYRAIEAFALNVVQTMEGLEKNDLVSLRAIIRRVQTWHRILPLVQKPLKHIGEGTVGLIQLLLAPLISLLDGRISWQAGIVELQKNFSLQQVPVEGTRGYYTCRTRKRYAASMALWLTSNAESSRWENGKWELTATHAGKGVKMWPPDLNNLRLLAYLELLGWTIDVKSAGDSLILTVDFGNWTAQ